MSPRERRPAAIAATLWIAVAGYAAYAFVPMVHGFFLSDDFVPLVLFEQWRGEGRLGSMLLSKFWSGLDAGGNHFYRPLSYLTFAMNEAISGIEPRGWMLATVGLHIANGLLVAAVAIESSPDKAAAPDWAAAALGAALFLFFAPGVEVAAWISGRFDGTATLFSLLAVLAFLCSRRPWDAAWWGSLAAMACACLCKESAAVVPFAIVFYARFVRLAPVRGLAGWISAVRMAWPWLALAAAYLALRWAMFGSATGVYENTKPLRALMSVSTLGEIAAALPSYLRAQFPLAHAAAILVALTLAQLGAVAFWRPAGVRDRGVLLAPLCTAIMAFLLLVPSAYFPANGIGGRLLYQSMAFYAVFTAVATRHARQPLAVAAIAVGLVITHGAIQREVLGRWAIAHAQMRAVVTGIHGLEERLAADDFALVLLPQSMQRVPFAGNAQAGLMLPPLNPPATSRRLLVQVYEELPEFPGKLEDGIVPGLREFTVMEYLAGKRAASRAIVYPTQVWCWDAAKAALLRVDALAWSMESPDRWVRDMQAALQASPCAVRS